MLEFALIDRIRKANDQLGQHVVIPPGDDLGMLELENGLAVLAGVDQVIGDIHLPRDASPERYGRKLVNRNLSDVAAMGAVPIGLIVSAALPPDFTEEWGGRFSDALRAAGGAFNCPVFGGDVAQLRSRSDVPVLAATILAVPDSEAGGRVLLRNGARVDDQIWVTGCFGHSLSSDGGGHHETFEPRVHVAQELNRRFGEKITSMIDVSDGLAADSGHLARESQCRFEINGDCVPRRGAADVRSALCDGEDYELCFTVRPGTPIPAMLGDVPLTHIGDVRTGDGVVVQYQGAILNIDQAGWEHGA